MREACIWDCTGIPFHQVLQGKKRKGRPRTRVQPGSMLPRDTLSPVQAEIEAADTWNTTKFFGVSATDESAVSSQIRKSKRLTIMEGRHRPRE